MKCLIWEGKVRRCQVGRGMGLRRRCKSFKATGKDSTEKVSVQEKKFKVLAAPEKSGVGLGETSNRFGSSLPDTLTRKAGEGREKEDVCGCIDG